MANRKLYTTASFFDLIMGQLKEEGKVPDILDYALATHNPRELRDYEFDVLGQVNYGCEGIYLDLYFKGDIGDEREGAGEFGTIKTLDASDEAFHTMASLMADFQITATRFINQHLDEFTHRGYDVHFLREDGSVACACTHKGVTSFEEANQYVRERMKSLNNWYESKKLPIVTKCVIIDNRTGKEREF